MSSAEVRFAFVVLKNTLLVMAAPIVVALMLLGCAPTHPPAPIPIPTPAPIPQPTTFPAQVTVVTVDRARVPDLSALFTIYADPQELVICDYAGETVRIVCEIPRAAYGWSGHLHLEAKGYTSEDYYVPHVEIELGEVVMELARPPRPFPVTRAPLGPLPDGANGYNKDLTKVWPDGPPPREGCDGFVRADAWGVEIGAPKVPGGSAYGRVLSWILPRYGPEWFDRIMTAHAERGYTHFYLSAQDSMAPYGAEGRAVPPGDNMSLGEFVEMARRVKHDYGFCVEVFLLSKYFSPDHADAQTYINLAAPIIDALDSADAYDELIACWECNAFMSPGRPIIDYFRYVGERAHRRGKKAGMHFLTHYTNWHADGDPRGRFGFFDDIRGSIDRLHYQGDVEWSAEDYQGRLADTLIQITRQPWIQMVAFEFDAYKKWANPRPNEDDSAISCVVAMATYVPGARMAGYGGGCRWPDGRPF